MLQHLLLQYEESDGRFRIGFSGFLHGSQYVIKYTTGVLHDSYFCRTVKVSAAIDVTPLFVIAGTVIPIADPRIMTANDATNSSVITWGNLRVCKIMHMHA